MSCLCLLGVLCACRGNNCRRGGAVQGDSDNGRSGRCCRCRCGDVQGDSDNGVAGISRCCAEICELCRRCRRCC